MELGDIRPNVRIYYVKDLEKENIYVRNKIFTRLSPVTKLTRIRSVKQEGLIPYLRDEKWYLTHHR